MAGAVVYARVSTKEQAENLSLPTQLKCCRQYCERLGYEVVKEFVERGESAKTAERRELQELLSFCRNNKSRICAVIVYDISRLARQLHDYIFDTGAASQVRYHASIRHPGNQRLARRKNDGGCAGGGRSVRQ